jgi:hypothetical protein
MSFSLRTLRIARSISAASVLPLCTTSSKALSAVSFQCQVSSKSIGKIKPLFTRAPHQRLPVSRPCPPWKFPLATPPRQRLVSAGGGLAGRPPRATCSAHRAAGATGRLVQTLGLTCTGAAHVWDGGHGTVATFCHTRRCGERLMQTHVGTVVNALAHVEAGPPDGSTRWESVPGRSERRARV